MVGAAEVVDGGGEHVGTPLGADVAVIFEEGGGPFELVVFVGFEEDGSGCRSIYAP